MTKEALTLALEALEKALRYHGVMLLSDPPQNAWKYHRVEQTADEAIAAIKEALAQPEQEKERCVGCEACIDTACGRDECPKGWPKAAQPEHEPVAWRNAAIRVGEDLCSVGPFGYYDMNAEQWLDWALSVVTVHAPPPQRTWVELTAGEISKIWGELPQTSNEEKDAIEFGFAIETALRKRNA